MQLKDVTETFIKGMACSRETFLKGQYSALNDMVENLNISQNTLRGTVNGNHGQYAVEISLTPEQAQFTCNCPKSEKGCKHVVAVLYEFLREKDTLLSNTH